MPLVRHAGMSGHGANGMKRALLVMVHGSPNPDSNDDMFEVVENVRSRGLFDRVEVGFLDLNAPDIETAIQTCVQAGAEAIVAVPYFLHSGRHVTRDLPDLLIRAAARFPAVAITMTDFIGSRPEIMDAIAARVRDACSES